MFRTDHVLPRQILLLMHSLLCLLSISAHAGMSRYFALSGEWEQATETNKVIIAFHDQIGFNLSSHSARKVTFSRHYSLESPLLLLGFNKDQIHLASVIATGPALDVTPLSIWQMDNSVFPDYQDTVIAVFQDSDGAFHFSHFTSTSTKQPEDPERFAKDLPFILLDSVPLRGHLKKYMSQERQRSLQLVSSWLTTPLPSHKKAEKDQGDDSGSLGDISVVVLWHDWFTQSHKLPTYSMTPSDQESLAKLSTFPIAIGQSLTMSPDMLKEKYGALITKAKDHQRMSQKKLDEYEQLAKRLSEGQCELYIDHHVTPDPDIQSLIQELSTLTLQPKDYGLLSSLRTFESQCLAYERVIEKKNRKLKTKQA